MTLEELKTRCEAQGFTYFYGEDEIKELPSYIAVHSNASVNFTADNKIYKKITTIELDYYYSSKDIQAQNKIEDIILGDVAWDKDDESYLEGENLWQVSYYFEILGG